MNNADDLLEAYFKGLREGQPKWIPVTERFPENEQDVLVYTFGYNIFVWTYHKACECWWEDESGYCCDIDDVSHWMPLPEPPEEVHLYELQSDMRDYCERYEPTYNPEDGSM